MSGQSESEAALIRAASKLPQAIPEVGGSHNKDAPQNGGPGRMAAASLTAPDLPLYGILPPSAVAEARYSGGYFGGGPGGGVPLGTDDPNVGGGFRRGSRPSEDDQCRGRLLHLSHQQQTPLPDLTPLSVSGHREDADLPPSGGASPKGP